MMKFIDQTVTFPSLPQTQQNDAAALQQAQDEGSSKQAKQTNFLFVNSRKGQIPKQIRQPMRSHVMQQARSKRKWSTSKGVVNSFRASTFDALEHDPVPKSHRRRSSSGSPANPLLLSPDGIGSQASSLPDEFDWPDASIQDYSVASSPYYTSVAEAGMQAFAGDVDFLGPLGTDMTHLNPYANLPVQLDAFQRGMLGLYLFNLNQCFALDGHADASVGQAWLAAASASRAFMYSILCAAATHMCALGQSSYYAVLQYKSAAITELNTTISDPVLGVTDGNIGAVFTLLCVDESFPLPSATQCPHTNPDGVSQRNMHLQGLKQMIQVRGGLMSLKVSSPWLYFFLLWHATTHSVASFEQSEYSPQPEELDSALHELTSAHNAKDDLDQMTFLLLASSASEPVLQAVKHVAALARHYTAWLAHDGTAAGFTNVGNFCGLVVQNLLSTLKLLSVDPSTTGSPGSEAVVTALLMFAVRAASEATPPLDSLHFVATGWFRRALRRAAQYQDRGAWDPRLRLWACTVGALCAQGSREVAEIEAAFLDACSVEEVTSSEELLDTLRGMVWIEQRFAEPVERLWERLEGRILITEE